MSTTSLLSLLVSFKMSAKLIIHKFGNGISKSLLITTAEGDELSETKFGAWTEGRTVLKNKDNEKARLVVKIATGSECAQINLDSCAKLINNLKASRLQTNPMYGCYQSFGNYGDYISENLLAGGINIHFDSFSESRNEQLKQNYDGRKDIFFNNSATDNSSNILLCPLDYSLEKVKANNECIMKNIHMLNRTLNYTKKKEILDKVCPKSMQSFPCDTCGKCFVYETGLKRHYMLRHAITEIPPRWQMVWTCIECFQVWPQEDLAMNHSKKCANSDNADCVREIKTSSLLQCEFCEKTFTSIPRLVRHAKTHTTQRNYECNICEASFLSYRAAEEHWLSCVWLKTYYEFTLPKLLLCHVCDRKFKNYNQLYNHRYKIGHFMAKSLSVSSDTYAYQCENCATYFPSIPQIQVHKQQCYPIYDLATDTLV